MDCRVAFDTFNRWITLSGFGPLFTTSTRYILQTHPLKGPRPTMAVLDDPEETPPPLTRQRLEEALRAARMGGGEDQPMFRPVGPTLGDAVEVQEVGLPPPPPPGADGPPRTNLGSFR